MIALIKKVVEMSFQTELTYLSFVGSIYRGMKYPIKDIAKKREVNKTTIAIIGVIG
jgi:hypothetical protein